MDYTALGQRIMKQRQLQRMTQKQLSEKAGISMSFLGNIERGAKKASIDTLVAISNALEISTDLLLQDSLNGLYDGVPGLTQQQKDLLSKFAGVLRESDY